MFDLSPPLSRFGDATLHAKYLPALDSDALLAHLNASGLVDDVALVLSAAMPLLASARPEAMPAEAEGEWWHLFGLMRGLSRLDEEVAHAERAHADQQTEASQRRLVGLVTARLDLVAIDPDE